MFIKSGGILHRPEKPTPETTSNNRLIVGATNWNKSIFFMHSKTSYCSVSIKGFTIKNGALSYTGAIGSTIQDVVFGPHSKIDNLLLSNCICEKTHYTLSFVNNSKIKSSTMSGCSIYGSVFTEVEFDHSKLENANFKNSVFTNCLFKNVVFRNISFKDIEFNSCRFHNVVFEDCSFSGEEKIKETFYIPDLFVLFLRCEFKNTMFKKSTFNACEPTKKQASTYFTKCKTNEGLWFKDCDTIGATAALSEHQKNPKKGKIKANKINSTKTQAVDTTTNKIEKKKALWAQRFVSESII